MASLVSVTRCDQRRVLREDLIVDPDADFFADLRLRFAMAGQRALQKRSSGSLHGIGDGLSIEPNSLEPRP
jgi:hypothetical protein